MQALGQGDLFRRVRAVVEVAGLYGLASGVDDDGPHGAVVGEDTFVHGGLAVADAEHLDGQAVRVALAGQEHAVESVIWLKSSAEVECRRRRPRARPGGSPWLLRLRDRTGRDAGDGNP
ncbi:hypothetical protein ACWEQ2_44185 [Streptomyces sp. NPDC004096]